MKLIITLNYNGSNKHFTRHFAKQVLTNLIIMFKNIKLSEVLIFAKQGVEGFTTDDGDVVNPKSKEEVLEDIKLIDDLLSIMKSKMLLNKKKGLKAVIDGRLALAVVSKSIRAGGTNHF